MITPNWVLSVLFWLHMIATVTWIGGLAILSLIIYPIAKKTLDNDAFNNLIYKINKKLNPLGWFGLSVLTVTGLIQMSANPNYEGFLSIKNIWSGAMLAKHSAFILIIAISAYQTWTLSPELERVAIRRQKGLESPNSKKLQLKEKNIILINLSLGILVLLLTAIARIS